MYISVDIGGTNTRIGASRDGRRFFALEKFKTPRKFEDGMRAIVAYIRRQGLPDRGRGGLASRCPKIAIAVPGPVDRAGRVLHVPNLPGWRGKISARALSRTFHAPVTLVNDADAGGLGEAVRGAGRGYDRVGYLTVSTGIGGALIINKFLPLLKGEIKRGSGHTHTLIISAEPGHQILFPGGRKCGAGHPGCFEAYSSGTGFYKTYGIRPEKCKDKKIWAKHAQILGWGVINVIRLWTPDIMVIGGGLSQSGPLLFNPLRTYVRAHLKHAKPPPILPAKLGDNAGLYGCLEILKSHHP